MKVHVGTLTSRAGPRLLQRLPEGQQPQAYGHFQVTPLAPTVGAELRGLDLRAPMGEPLFAELDAETFARVRELVPIVEHPVVRRHPATGRRTLFVNRAFTKRILGLAAAESERLLHFLTEQASIPEYQCRVRWQPDTLVFWDNRAV